MVKVMPNESSWAELDQAVHAWDIDHSTKEVESLCQILV